MNKNNKFLSPSRVDTFNSCSFYYYVNYHLQVPTPTNNGAIIGSIVHEILEYLLKKRRAKYVEKIILSYSCSIYPALWFFIEKRLVSNNIELNIAKEIDKLILTALSYNFYGPPGAVIYGEKEFEEIIEYNGYKFGIKGIIDKYFIYNENGQRFIYCQDYKTDKTEWAALKKEVNLQYYIYLLYFRNKYPDIPIKNIKFEFLFLRFPNNLALQMPEISEEVLCGVSSYLQDIYKRINNFTHEDAFKNFAIDQGFPSKEEGFCKAAKCNIHAKKKGQLKKDGTPMWACPLKWDFEYYGLFDSNNQLIKTSLKFEDLHPKNNEIIKRMKYSGCPKFNKY